MDDNLLTKADLSLLSKGDLAEFKTWFIRRLAIFMTVWTVVLAIIAYVLR
jgi:hypothetical protein